MASCGLDFVFIDTEHIPIDRATLSWMCNAYKLAGLPPPVRIPEPDPYVNMSVICSESILYCYYANNMLSMRISVC